MSRTDLLVQKLKRRLLTQEMQSTIELLTALLEFLENKEDPEPEEIQLTNELSQFTNSIDNLKQVLTEFTSKKLTLKGDKLQDLYNRKATCIGSQVLFE